MDALPEIRIGTAGWSYKDWDGVFYPPGMQRGKRHALEFLAQCFDVVEINTSFYGHIKPELAKLWGAQGRGESKVYVHREIAPLVHAFSHCCDGADLGRNHQAQR